MELVSISFRDYVVSNDATNGNKKM